MNKIKFHCETMTATEMRFYEDDKKLDILHRSGDNGNYNNSKSLHRRRRFCYHIYLLLFIFLMIFYLSYTCGGELIFFFKKIEEKIFSEGSRRNPSSDRVVVYGYRFAEDGSEVSSFTNVIDG